MKKMMAMLMACGLCAGVAKAHGQGNTINGAGASFPAPVYRVWTYLYSEKSNIRVNYQSLGSGAGINQIKSGTVALGGSDNPLEKSELDKHGLIQFPMLMGGVVLAINVPGISSNQLKLDQETLSKIFLGEITNWNDRSIARLNSGLNLPDLKITVVSRADSSGTTYIFTNYLSKISKVWAEKIGAGPAVNWPVGIRGQKNPGVCNNIKKIRGAIGYTEYTYAIESKLSTVVLRNLDGNFVSPTIESFKAAGANSDWRNAPGFRMILTEQPGADSWPITGLTYLLIHREQKDSALAKSLLDYIKWCFEHGAQSAIKLHYVPMPENVIKMVYDELDKVRYEGKK